ncbi:hypothetical protein [Rickettsiella endosymbiont of Dermanyssus gallinae]|uniref:hypothetical protein n=1 Tax=Rickettsiella endosymbiont of Dermanyssus gallinae TaxID=2856608 RepID=UPI001C52F67C|nr:hypothetical protein [Rickettsiella endosymbiont of Dermanyssus gallinae]
MSSHEMVVNLLNTIVEKDKAFNSKIQKHWGETEKFDKNQIPIGHAIKVYYLIINHSAVRNLLYQAIRKEMAKLKIKEEK